MLIHIYSPNDEDGYHIMVYDKGSPEWTLLNGEHNLIVINMYATVTHLNMIKHIFKISCNAGGTTSLYYVCDIDCGH